MSSSSFHAVRSISIEHKVRRDSVAGAEPYHILQLTLKLDSAITGETHTHKITLFGEEGFPIHCDDLPAVRLHQKPVFGIGEG